MITDKIGVIFRTACGAHRYALLEADAPDEVLRPLMPYKKNTLEADIQKALKDPLTKTRRFKFTGHMEYGAYSESCRVYEEVAE